MFHIANRSDVNTVSFTGKGEITANIDSIQIFERFLRNFSPYFSCELQTNGVIFADNTRLLDTFKIDGLHTVAISIDNVWDFGYFQNVFNRINDLGMTVRVTANLTDSIMSQSIQEYISICHQFGIQQLSFREITVPNHEIANTRKSQETKEWIEENIDKEQVNNFINEYNNFIKEKGFKVWTLPYGATIYSVEGISLTQFDYCIQDTTDGDDIRSLIFHEDGHLSTSWYGSNVGRIL